MKFTTFSYSLIFLCAGFCCPEENDLQAEIYKFEREDLIIIEDSKTSFDLNDTIWIRTEVPVNLEYEGRDLNLTEISGNSDRLGSSFGFYQVTNFENPLEVNLSESELIPRIGDVTAGNAINFTAYLEDTMFINEFGIILKQPGNFLISSNYRPNTIFLYLETTNYTSVYIKTSFKDSEDPDRYLISVN